MVMHLESQDSSRQKSKSSDSQEQEHTAMDGKDTNVLTAIENMVTSVIILNPYHAVMLKDCLECTS